MTKLATLESVIHSDSVKISCFIFLASLSSFPNFKEIQLLPVLRETTFSLRNIRHAPGLITHVRPGPNFRDHTLHCCYSWNHHASARPPPATTHCSNNIHYTATKAEYSTQLHPLRSFHVPRLQLQLLRCVGSPPPLSGSGALTLLAAVTCSSCDMHQHAHSNLHDSKAIHGLTEVHQLHTTPSTPAVHLLPPVAHHTSGPAWSATARTMQTACRHRRRLPSTNTKNTAAIRSDDHSPRAASWIFLVAIIKTSCSG